MPAALFFSLFEQGQGPDSALCLQSCTYFKGRGMAGTACIGLQSSLGTKEDNHLERFTVVTSTGGGTTGGEVPNSHQGEK